MTTDDITYSARELFVAPAALGPGQTAPRIFGSPSRYIQGPGTIDHAGHYLSRLGFRRCTVLLTARCLQAEGGRLVDSIRRSGLTVDTLAFGGECSFEEIERQTAALRARPEAVDGLVAVGGGKVIDAGRAIAQRLGIPVAAVPSLASNDAPCAALSVIYTNEGVTADAEIYDSNPVLVLVDTTVIAQADARYLVAGMGDAMATWYEARACARNPGGMTVFGGRPTLAATALAELCANTLYAHGVAAQSAVQAHRVDESLEKIVEANILLSGLGYESGGLAVAHAVAQGYTVIDRVHRNFMHGEMVAMGVLAQLMLEDSAEEADKAARFFVAVGLPVSLKQLDLSVDNQAELQAVVAAAMAFPFIANMPFEVSADTLLAAMVAADELGRSLLA